MGRTRRFIGIGIAVFATSNSIGSMILTSMAWPSVGMVAQCNILVWDPATKTEQLVQSSAFMSKAEKFEFLVPTPSIPKVKEVGNEPITFLSSLIYPPRPVTATPKPNHEDDLDSNYGTLIRGKVEVKQVELVGNLKATTILASDVIALSEWMDKNGYKASLEQKKWLETYVQKRWFLTAFQVYSKSEVLRTSAVRLSFKTEVPFVPYASPKDCWVDGIRHEMFVISPTPLEGTIGGKFAWSPELQGHTFLNSGSTKGFAKSLGISAKEIPVGSWVDRYIDIGADSAAADDLYFFPKPKGVKK